MSVEGGREGAGGRQAGTPKGFFIHPNRNGEQGLHGCNLSTINAVKPRINRFVYL